MIEVKYIDVTPGDATGYIASYLVFSDRYTFIVETGPSSSVDKLLGGLEGHGLSLDDLDFIVVTHIHLDHGGGAGDLVSLNNSLKVYVHPRGYPHLNNPSKLWSASRSTLGEVALLYGEPKPIPLENLFSTDDGYSIDLGDDVLEFIHTPGHASHHMSILLRDSGYIFTGDSAGINDGGYIIPVTPTPHNPEKAIDSIRRMLARSPRYACFTHYGIYEGVEYLNKALHKWMWWRDYLYKLYRDGYSVDEAYRLLIEEDEDSRHMSMFYKRIGLGGDEIKIGIEGMYNYFRWVERG